MGFSITSAVLGGVIIICYGQSIVLAFYVYDEAYPKVITLFIFIFGIMGCAIGICAAVSLSWMKPCTCCNTPAQQVRHPRLMTRTYTSF